MHCQTIFRAWQIATFCFLACLARRALPFVAINSIPILQMKIALLLTFALASSSFAAGSTEREDVLKAVQKLGEKSNYSWRTTIVVPEDAPFKPGPTEGKTDKEGLTLVVMTLFDNKAQFVIKGEKAAALSPAGTWMSIEELEKEEGPGQFLALIMHGVKTPTKEAAELAKAAPTLKKEGDFYSSDLTVDGAKELQMWGRPGDPNRPTVTNAKGSVKFWIKDGVLTKYEFKLKGNISFNGNDFPNERTTTVDIKDVDATKLDIPEAAKKKIAPSTP